MNTEQPAERMSEDRKLAFRHYLTPDASLSVSALRQVGREIFDELDAVEADKNTALLHLAQALAERHSIRTERDEIKTFSADLQKRILNAHIKALPQSWVYTDPEMTIDLLVAEISTTRAERDAAIADKDEYAEVLEDKRRLTLELDVIVNGADAAKQSSLCDMVAQIRSVVPKLRAERDAAIAEREQARNQRDAAQSDNNAVTFRLSEENEDYREKLAEAIAERDALRAANVEIYALATRALADPSGTAELVEICEVVDGLHETCLEAQSNGTK